MNLANLKVALLALVFAWSQVCCCQVWGVWAAVATAGEGRDDHAAHIAAHIAAPCCRDSAPAEQDPGHKPPCKDHRNCGGCVQRLGWIPEGPAELSFDLVGASIPPATFAEPAPLAPQQHTGHGFACDTERSRRCSAPTLLRLRCALVI